MCKQLMDNIEQYKIIFRGKFLRIDNLNIDKEDIKMYSRVVDKWINEPIKNPKGEEIIDYLKDNGGKYLSDYDSDIIRLIDEFY